MKIVFIFCITIVFIEFSYSQFGYGYGYVSGRNYYEFNTYPKTESDSCLKTSGGAAGIFWGTKAWLGTKRYSISVEGQLNLSPFSFDMQEFKGIGSVSVPLIARLNYGALSGKDMIASGKGFSIGAGVQYNKTEILFIPKQYKNLNRKYYQSYFVEVVFGSGIRRAGHFGYFVRYGFAPERLSTASVGFFALTSGFSLPRIIRLKRIRLILKNFK